MILFGCPGRTNITIIKWPDLEPREQVRLQLVSKRLFALARDNSLWRLHCYEQSWTALDALRPQRKTSGSLVGNATTAPLSSLGQSSLRSLIQPQSVVDTSLREGNREDHGEHEISRATSFGKRSRAAAFWDPSVQGEDVDWYSEYIARHGPISLSWLQQPFAGVAQGNRKIPLEIKGLGLLRDWSSARENRVVAPLEDGSVCIWDLNHSHSSEAPSWKGKLLGISRPGLLMADLSRRKGASGPTKPHLEFLNVGECVSVDSIRRRAYVAMGNVLNEVDLETLQLVSQPRFPFSIFAMSQETDYSVPLTLATTLSLQIYDSRLPALAEEEAISLRCEREVTPLVQDSRLFTQPDSPLLQLQPNGLPPHRIRSPDPSPKGTNYAPLFQPGPLSILHPPAPHVNSILLAGRFPSILCYDRRYFPRLQTTVHSGARLCGLASVPAPRFPMFADATWPASHTVVACGEYNGRGSLELYDLSSFARENETDLPDLSSGLSPIYNNRQSAASSKLLSVASHGTRIAYSDADGNIKWVERDGKVEVRRWNINSPRPSSSRRREGRRNLRDGTTALADQEESSDGGTSPEREPTGLWRSLHRGADTDSAVARKILPTGGHLTGDELLIWTGEKIGRVKFSIPAERDAEDDEQDLDGDFDAMLEDEETMDGATRRRLRRRRQEEEQQEREYERRMRRVLERQADEVRWMGRLGMA